MIWSDFTSIERVPFVTRSKLPNIKFNLCFIKKKNIRFKKAQERNWLQILGKFHLIIRLKCFFEIFYFNFRSICYWVLKFVFLYFFMQILIHKPHFFCWTHVFSLHVVSSGFYYFWFCKCNTLGNKYGALAPTAVYIIMWYWLKFSSHEGRRGLMFQNIYLFKPVKKNGKIFISSFFRIEFIQSIF